MAWRAERGSQRAPKASKKGPQNESKFVKNPSRHSLACPGRQGVPPGASKPPGMHIYAFLCIDSCIFIDIYAYLCIYSAYLCIFRHIYVYFMHIYTYLCKRDAYLCISMHIYTYLCISMHCIFTHTFSYKDVDILLMKNCAAGLHSTGS